VQLEDVDKWRDPLMGWTSSGDGSQVNMFLGFDSKTAAVRYCEDHGMDYQILEPNQERAFSHAYADNFKYAPNRRKGK